MIEGITFEIDDTEAELLAMRAGVRDQLKERAERKGKAATGIYPQGLTAEAFTCFGQPGDRGWFYRRGPLPVVLFLISQLDIIGKPFVQDRPEVGRAN